VSVSDCDQPSAAISPARPAAQSGRGLVAVQNLAEFFERASESGHSNT